MNIKSVVEFHPLANQLSSLTKGLTEETKQRVLAEHLHNQYKLGYEQRCIELESEQVNHPDDESLHPASAINSFEGEEE